MYCTRSPCTALGHHVLHYRFPCTALGHHVLHYRSPCTALGHHVLHYHYVLQVTLLTDDIELAGNIIQALSEDLSIEVIHTDCSIVVHTDCSIVVHTDCSIVVHTDCSNTCDNSILK